MWQKYWLYLQSNKHELHIQFLFHNSNVQTHKSNGIEQKIHTSFYGHLNMPFIHTYVYHSLSLYPLYTYVHTDICTCIQKTDWERHIHTHKHTSMHALVHKIKKTLHLQWYLSIKKIFILYNHRWNPSSSVAHLRLFNGPKYSVITNKQKWKFEHQKIYPSHNSLNITVKQKEKTLIKNIKKSHFTYNKTWAEIQNGDQWHVFIRAHFLIKLHFL